MIPQTKGEAYGKERSAVSYEDDVGQGLAKVHRVLATERRSESAARCWISPRWFSQCLPAVDACQYEVCCMMKVDVCLCRRLMSSCKHSFHVHSDRARFTTELLTASKT